VTQQHNKRMSKHKFQLATSKMLAITHSIIQSSHCHPATATRHAATATRAAWTTRLSVRCSASPAVPRTAGPPRLTPRGSGPPRWGRWGGTAGGARNGWHSCSVCVFGGLAVNCYMLTWSGAIDWYKNHWLCFSIGRDTMFLVRVFFFSRNC
jgi:hypothetical protein